MPSIDGSMWSHQLSLPPDPTSPSRARQFVRTQLRCHDLLPLVDDVELVVSELATNAVLHARTALVVTLQGDGQRVLLTVLDYCSVFAPRGTPTGPDDVEGRGLAITDLVSDEWGIVNPSQAAKSVWASFSTAVHA